MSTQNKIIIAIALVLSIGLGVLLAVAGGDDASEGPADPGKLKGLQETKAPWKPELKDLRDRIVALGIPAPGRETYHVHARLSVFVDGKQQPVPDGIGINRSAALFAGLHTHGTDGVIHIESDAPFEVELGDFFGVWGVKFTDTQIGAYRNEGNKSVQVFVNGKKIANAKDYVVKRKDDIVVGYGAPGSFPKKPKTPFPSGL